MRANPADKDTRLRLLRHYMTLAPRQDGMRSPFQGVRLGHVLYFIEIFPSDPVSSSALTYVPSEHGPFADAGDHVTVRKAWTLAAGLMKRARELGSQEAELRGPMPLVREFQEFQQAEVEGVAGALAGTAAASPAIRVDGTIQSSKLVETLLNGTPVKVIHQGDVPFTFSN